MSKLLKHKTCMLANLLLGVLVLGCLLATSCGKNKGNLNIKGTVPNLNIEEVSSNRPESDFTIKGKLSFHFNNEELLSHDFSNLKHSIIDLNNRGLINEIHKNRELMEMFSMPEIKLLNLINALESNIHNCEVRIKTNFNEIKLFSFTNGRSFDFIEDKEGMNLKFDNKEDCHHFFKYHHSYFIQIPSFFSEERQKVFSITNKGVSKLEDRKIVGDEWEKIVYKNNEIIYLNNQREEKRYSFEVKEMNNISNLELSNIDKRSLIKINYEQNTPVREKYFQRVNADFRYNAQSGTYAKNCNIEHFRINEKNWKEISESSFPQREIHYHVPKSLSSNLYKKSNIYELTKKEKGQIYIEQLYPEFELSYGFDNEYDCSKISRFGYNIRDLVDRNQYTKITSKQVRMHVKIFSWY